MTVGEIPLSLHNRTRALYCQHGRYQRLIPVIPPLLSCHCGEFTTQTRTTNHQSTISQSWSLPVLLESQSVWEYTPTTRDRACSGPSWVKYFILNRGPVFVRSNSSSRSELMRHSLCNKHMLLYEGPWRHSYSVPVSTFLCSMHVAQCILHWVVS